MDNITKLLTFLQDSILKLIALLLDAVQMMKYGRMNVVNTTSYQLMRIRVKLQPQIVFHREEGDTKNPIFEVIKIARKNFYDNADLCYSEYIPFLKSSLRSTSVDYFKRKSELYRKSIQFNNRSKIIENIYNISKLINVINKENSNTNQISLDIKKFTRF